MASKNKPTTGKKNNDTNRNRMHSFKDLKALLDEEYIEHTQITEYSVEDYDYYDRCIAIELFRIKSEDYNEYLKVICNKFSALKSHVEVTRTMNDIETVCNNMVINSISPIQAILFGTRSCEELLQKNFYEVARPVANLIVSYIKNHSKYKIDLIWCIHNWIWKYQFMLCIAVAQQLSDYDVNAAIFKRYYDDKFQNNRENIRYEEIPVKAMNMNNVHLKGIQYDITKLLVNDKDNLFFQEIISIMKKLDSDSISDKRIINELIADYYNNLDKQQKKEVDSNLSETYNDSMILFLIKDAADKNNIKDKEYPPNKIKLYFNTFDANPKIITQYLKDMKSFIYDYTIREEMANSMMAIYRHTDGIPELAYEILNSKKDLTIKTKKSLILCLKNFHYKEDVRKARIFLQQFLSDHECRNVVLAELVLLGEPQYLDELAENLLMARSIDQFKDAQYALRQIIIKQQSVKLVRSKLAYQVKKYIEEDVEIENIIYNYCAYCDNESNTLDEELIDVLIGLFGESQKKYSAILYLKILNTLYRDILLKKNAEKYIGTFYEIKENCSNKLIYDKVCRIIEDPDIWRSSNLELVEGEN